MSKIFSENCMVCGNEFSSEDLKSITLANKTINKFKICFNCLEKSDTQNDYSDVKKIILSYIKFEELMKNSKQ